MCPNSAIYRSITIGFQWSPLFLHSIGFFLAFVWQRLWMKSCFCDCFLLSKQSLGFYRNVFNSIILPQPFITQCPKLCIYFAFGLLLSTLRRRLDVESRFFTRFHDFFKRKTSHLLRLNVKYTLINYSLLLTACTQKAHKLEICAFEQFWRYRQMQQNTFTSASVHNR